MKWTVSLVLIALLSLTAELYLPFWSVPIAAFLVVALIPQRPWRAFLCGFLALFLLWGGLAFYFDSANNHILSNRVSLLIFQFRSPWLLIAVTGLIGGLLGGLPALTAGFLRTER